MYTSVGSSLQAKGYILYFRGVKGLRCKDQRRFSSDKWMYCPFNMKYFFLIANSNNVFNTAMGGNFGG